MKRSVAAGVLAVGIAAQFGVIGAMIARRELTLRHGEVYRFKTAPVDPYDAFRGRYVALRLQDASQMTEVRFVRNQRVYARVGTDTNGFAVIEKIAAQAEPEGVWFKTRVSYCREDWGEPKGTNRAMVLTGRYRTRLDLPFDRYYMAEKLAPEAENAYRDANRRGATNDAAAVVRIWRGFPVLAGVEIGGRRIEEVAREKKGGEEKGD